MTKKAETKGTEINITVVNNTDNVHVTGVEANDECYIN